METKKKKNQWLPELEEVRDGQAEPRGVLG